MPVTKPSTFIDGYDFGGKLTTSLGTPNQSNSGFNNPLPVDQSNFLGAQAPTENNNINQSSTQLGASAPFAPIEDNSHVRMLGAMAPIDNTVNQQQNNNSAGLPNSTSQIFDMSGMNGTGAFIPGNHQVTSQSGTNWPVNFESVQGNPFSSNQNTAGGTKGLYGG